jgi:hypothetical protein
VLIIKANKCTPINKHVQIVNACKTIDDNTESKSLFISIDISTRPTIANPENIVDFLN